MKSLFITFWMLILNTYPWSFLIAPMTPSTNGHPGPRLSPWLWRICNTHSNCLSRISGWLILDISFNGFSKSNCSLWKEGKKLIRKRGSKRQKALLLLFKLKFTSTQTIIVLETFLKLKHWIWFSNCYHQRFILSSFFKIRENKNQSSTCQDFGLNGEWSYIKRH